MLKIIKFLSIFVLFAGVFLLVPKKTFAQCACDCICVENGTEVGACDCDNPSCDRGSPSLTVWGGNCNSPTPPPGGGGGSCSRDYAGVNCPGGYEKSPNLIRSDCISDRQLLCNQPNPNYPYPNTNYWVGTAQSVGACCAENDDGFCTAHFLNEHVCVPACPVGTTQQCGLTNFGNYQRYNSCYTPNLCNDSNDVYIPTAYSSSAAGTCYCNCDPETKKCRRTCDDEDKIYNVVTTCQNMSYSCSCVPTGCTATSPSTPALLSPSNGATVATTQTSLMWNNTSQTWGTGCPANNNLYNIYLGTSAGSLALAGSLDDSRGSVTVTGTSGTTYYWKIEATNGSRVTSSPTWSFTITLPNLDPWWQVKDGDVTTNGDITSLVPDANLFDTVGLGGFPGVPVFGGSFSLIGNPSRISATRWNVDTATFQSRLFNYSYFNNLIPDDVNFNNVSNLGSGGSAYSDSYQWFKATGNTTISGDINIGNRKVILFIENGNLTINGKINLNDGNGFFGAFVDGNIIVGNSVTGTPSLEGVYLSNGSFSSGAGTSQLHIRGSVASFGGINLQRNLSNNATAAELFEFAPDQMFLFPQKLMFRRNKWAEVAP